MADPVSPEMKQNRMKEFLPLLPLTIELAGLPPATGTLFSEGQMEARVMSIRTAFKLAKQLVRDIGENG